MSRPCPNPRRSSDGRPPPTSAGSEVAALLDAFAERVPGHRLTDPWAPAAVEDRFDAAGQHLADAADQIRSVPIRLLDTDVLLGCAALAYHAGDHHRASEILASFRGNVRSPASFAIYVHYRDLLEARLSKPELAAILEQTAELDPAEVLDRELAAIATTHIPQAHAP